MVHARGFRAFRPAVPSLAALFLILSTPARVSADWGPGTFMLQALGRMMDAGLRVAQQANYGYDDGICIMAAFLAPGESIDFVRTVEKGKSYLIAGGGDDDVDDLDVAILDEAGREIASDMKDDNHPVVVFTAKYSGKIIIRQKLFGARRGSFCVVSVLREGGWNVSKNNLIRSAAGIIASANFVDSRHPDNVSFHAGSNQWALYGCVFRSGESIEITNINLGTGRRVFLAAGDTQARDIDLHVTAADKLFKDDDPDATPIVDITVKNGSASKLKIHNAESGGPSLILATVLQLD